MKNVAGDTGCTDLLREELNICGINIIELQTPQPGEVPSLVTGELLGWKFTRAWYYWMASGPPIPFEIADRLHDKIGREVRVAGHCGCPSPREWYKHGETGVDSYHVDSRLGLYLLSEAIREAFSGK